MGAAEELVYLSIEEYLASEEASEVKREYVAGVVYNMSGAKLGHNRISMNAARSLGNHLEGKKCEPFNSDMKVRVQTATGTRFYYPDLSVSCTDDDQQATYLDFPVVIVEVLSDSTRRTDLHEKRDAYLMIPSLRVYLIVESNKPLVIVYRRGEDGSFVESKITDPAVAIPLPEIDAELSLGELYAGIEFPG